MLKHLISNIRPFYQRKKKSIQLKKNVKYFRINIFSMNIFDIQYKNTINFFNNQQI